MFRVLLPKEFNFYDLFEKQINAAVAAADYFNELVSKGAVDEVSHKKMQGIEHEGDEAAHAIIAHLNQTFITPFDREDIHALAKEIDDIIDMLNTIVNRMKVYKIAGVNQHLIQFSTVIQESVRAVASAVKGLRTIKNLKSVSESCIEVNRLENVGDAMRDVVLSKLFETEKDPIAVIKLKEVYEDAETVLDICEDVAHLVESILVKQA